MDTIRMYTNVICVDVKENNKTLIKFSYKIDKLAKL